ncbi:hypothetical protein KAW48_03245, partial [candidate division WOR-3 bacterium]|nr:hypothetical protein [candidate division WOR-3 bacterium]
MLKPKSLVLLVVLVCLMVPAVAQGEVTYLGNGHYKAVLNAITDDSTKSSDWGSVEYYRYWDIQDSTYKYDYERIGFHAYMGRDDNQNWDRDEEKFRGWLYYRPLSWDIPDNAEIDSVFLILIDIDSEAGDSLPLIVRSLTYDPIMALWTDTLWDSIGAGYSYASEMIYRTQIYPVSIRLIGAEYDLQKQIDDPFEDWFALGLTSDWEYCDGYLFEIDCDALNVYFRVPPSITV